MQEPARNYIAKGLGAFWLLDGLLQLQPQMFGQNFVNHVLAPVLANQPSFIDAIVTLGIRLWDTNTAVTNTAAALLQMAIGVLLFFPLSSKQFRAGLWVSIVWGLVVWLCGEGAGQLLTGGASFYTGAPGAVAVYILIAVLLLVPEKVSIAWYPRIAGAICALGALLQLQPSFWTVDGAQGTLMASMMDPVNSLIGVPNYFYTVLGLDPVASNLILVILLVVVGVALLWKPNKITGTLALVFLFFVWWFGQDFGQLSTLFAGTMTDPNTAPVFALLLVPLFVGVRSQRNTSTT